MTNNDILKRIRYNFSISDPQMIDIFKLAEKEVNREIVCNWLKKEDEFSFAEISDEQLATFLNGFIIQRRGKKDGPQPVPEKSLSNNAILRKLKIALNLQSDDILDLFDSKGRQLSKHELSAFFRKPDHKSYKTLNDQYLRNFLHALQTRYRQEGNVEDSNI